MAVWPFGKRKRKEQEIRSQSALEVSKPNPSNFLFSRSERSNTVNAVPDPHSAATDVTPPRPIVSPAPNTPSILGSMRTRRAGRVDSSIEQSSLLSGSERRSMAPGYEERVATSPHLRSATFSDLPRHRSDRYKDSSEKQGRKPAKLQRKSSATRELGAASSMSAREPYRPSKEDIREEDIVPGLYKSHKQMNMSRSNSKRKRDGIGLERERPMSDVSLPWQSHTDSWPSSTPDARNYRISMLDMVAPRPTLRYSTPGPPASWAGSFTEVDNLARSNSKRNKKPDLSREALKENRPVDILAENLDAAELREIMERDQRRRERRREREAEKLRRRLERRAERDRQKEVYLEDQRAHNNVIIHDASGLGITSTRASILGIDGLRVDSRSADLVDQPMDDSMDIDTEPMVEMQKPGPDSSSPVIATGSPGPTIYQDKAAVQSLPSPERTPILPPMPQDPEPIRSVQPKASFAHSQSEPESSLSQHTQPEMLEPVRRGILATLFKRGTNKRRSSNTVRATPPPESSFENISRESMARATPPPHLRNESALGSRSATPVRTQSRFREDLPELPLSPPESRMQSPEAPGRDTPLSFLTAGRQDDTIRSQSPLASIHRSTLVSQSVASVDSEGSWFAGRPVQRLQAGSINSAGFLSEVPAEGNRNLNDVFSDVPDDDDEEDDDDLFFGGRSAGSMSELSNGEGVLFGPTGKAYLEEDEQPTNTAVSPSNLIGRARGNSVRQSGIDEDLHIVTGISRQPTVIHRGLRVKSSEGLLNLVSNAEPTDSRLNQSSRISRNLEPASRTFFIDEPSRASSMVDLNTEQEQLATPPSSQLNPHDQIPSADDGLAASVPTPTPGESDADTAEDYISEGLQRATSVKTSGHGRNISAGSAKLFEIVRRNSPGPNELARSISLVSDQAPSTIGADDNTETKRT